MKDLLVKIIDSDYTDEDKLYEITEILKTPARYERRKSMQRFTRVWKYLTSLAMDYQLDPLHDDYCGFINVTHEDYPTFKGEGEGDFKWMCDNTHLYTGLLNEFGLKLESAQMEEFILTTIKNEK